MKLGFVFPQYEIPPEPQAIREIVQSAEGMGFDYVLPYEHVLGANPERPGGWHGPYTHTHAFHEPMVLFGYLAGITQHIEFVTGILILPQRQTALVAKQAAQVDLLSGGRLRLGVGIGWNKVEYEALGQDFHSRGKRMEEQVTLMRRLWTEPLVTFQGEREKIDDAGLNPLPVQRPIPVWFGGGADVVLERMARMGDGWLPNSMPLEQARTMVAKLRGYLEQHNRPAESFGVDARINIARSTPDEWREQVAGWRELGATHICANTLGGGLTTVAEHLELLGQFQAETGL